MKKKTALFTALVLLALAGAVLAGAKEYNGWVLSNMCWVTKSPSDKAPIEGIIKQGAAVAAEESGKDWVKIIFAPIRDMKTGKYLTTGVFYTKKEYLTTVSPGQWRTK